MLLQTSDRITVSFDDTQHGAPVVLLHAFPLARDMWKPQREGLKASARIITPDLRGFGRTEIFHETNSIDVMADTVNGFLDALGIREPIVLGGLSMGGYVSFAFARKYPQRLRGLILADTKAEPDDECVRANRDTMIAFAREHTAADVFAKMLPRVVSERTRAEHPEIITEIERIAAAQSIPGIIGALQALRDRADSIPTLRTITVPTLVIVGSEDVITPPSAAETMIQHLPHGKLVHIPGAGHLANLEQPAAFNEAVRAFLAELHN